MTSLPSLLLHNVTHLSFPQQSMLAQYAPILSLYSAKCVDHYWKWQYNIIEYKLKTPQIYSVLAKKSYLSKMFIIRFTYYDLINLYMNSIWVSLLISPPINIRCAFKSISYGLRLQVTSKCDEFLVTSMTFIIYSVLLWGILRYPVSVSVCVMSSAHSAHFSHMPYHNTHV